MSMTQEEIKKYTEKDCYNCGGEGIHYDRSEMMDIICNCVNRNIEKDLKQKTNTLNFVCDTLKTLISIIENNSLKR